MVFRFTTAQDEELMRELILAEGVSRAVGSSLNAKQVRDRLHILKKQFKAGELQSKRASGTEESLNAVNVQSHYNDLPGLVGEYLELEHLHAEEKSATYKKNKQKEVDFARCAMEIVNESNHRRSQRSEEASGDDASDLSNADSATSATSSRLSRTPKAPKRQNAFLMEVQRQEKRHKQQLDLKIRELEQNQLQFDARLAFEAKQVEERLRFEERVQSSNRDLIIACAKIFSGALDKSGN
ncbi:hypothetical protein BBJ28_00009786 [Nothophytophthora sp. Chile5]|nr:hypothetical protein BBJ28_00009786 [Nothophytophthora sp. Chile5]